MIERNRLIPSVKAVYESSSAGFLIESFSGSLTMRNSFFANNYSPVLQNNIQATLESISILNCIFRNSSIPISANDLERFNTGGFAQI